MKNFYLKIIVFLLIIIGTYLSIDRYYTYTQNKNFTIINQRSSVIIQLPNTEYLEIISRNDSVSSSTYSDKPFSTNTKLFKNSNLENSIARTNVHTEEVENGDKRRFLSLTPLSNEYLRVQVDLDTQYSYEKDLYYSIQIDYTNKTIFEITEHKASFFDKGCKVDIVGENTELSITENSQSVIIRKKYEPKMTFKVNLNIECNK